MANKALFSSARGALLPTAKALNWHGVGAYEYEPRHKLAQYAVTGCLSNTYYADADEQLDTVMELIPQVDPSFVAKCAVDIVRMVHPQPQDRVREAFYGWLLGKPFATERLPATLQGFLRFQSDRSQELPDVPFQMLTALGLSSREWGQVALRGGWQRVRMNLNTFARHGVFGIPGMTERVAEKLVDREAITWARVFPYQLMAAFQSLDSQVPAAIREALQDAMEIAIENVPSLEASVAVCPDVPGRGTLCAGRARTLG